MPEVWSQLEVEAIVADYLQMLELDLRGVSYSKTEHRRGLMTMLNGRSEGSVERKHQNISAALIDAGFPYIPGYKPLFNYQALLAEVVVEQLKSNAVLVALVAESVQMAATVPSLTDVLDRFVDAPELRRDYGKVFERSNAPRIGVGVDYLAIEARNASLGRAGEELVVEFERARLARAGRASLADQVEHTAVERGDGYGFDVHSYEENGTDRLIEVKTTSYGMHTPFYVSRNEVRVSSEKSGSYALYRVFEFRSDPRLYCVKGALEREFRLEAVEFAARR